MLKFRGNPAAGFTLIELMVAITLGLLLLGGLSQVFLSNKVTFRTSEAMARVQENGRFALEIVKRNLREAGSNGFCAAELEPEVHLASSDNLDDILAPGRTVVGWEYAGTGAGSDFTLPDDLSPPGGGPWNGTQVGGLPPALQGRVVPGSDVLIVRRIQPVTGVTATNTNNSAINLNTNHGLVNNPVVMVTDCATGLDIFQVTNNESATSFNLGAGAGGASPGNVTGGGGGGFRWSTSYDESMQAFRIQINAYYIGIGAQGEPAFFVADLSHDQPGIVHQELATGVENMQVLYGFSRAAPAGDGQSIDDWVTASQVPNNGWPQIIALRIGFIMRSSDRADGFSGAQTFSVAEANITTSGDSRMRQTFSSTVALRNRLMVLRD